MQTIADQQDSVKTLREQATAADVEATIESRAIIREVDPVRRAVVRLAHPAPRRSRPKSTPISRATSAALMPSKDEFWHSDMENEDVGE